MIKNLHIKNFKSIKELKLDCSRINLFIGEPNTGKSNLLEALGLFNVEHDTSIKKYIRFDSIYDLIYRQDTNKDIEIDTDEFKLKFKFGNLRDLIVSRKNKPEVLFSCRYNEDGKPNERVMLKTDTEFAGEKVLNILFYKFKIIDNPNIYKPRYLTPPFGENIFAVIRNNNLLSDYVNNLFRHYGYEVINDISKKKIVLLEGKEKSGRTIIPYNMVSDTIQRLIFYTAILETNTNSTIILEEPEAHIFPYYNKYLAERISLYNENQFFISTHNPIFVNNIIDKTKYDELRVFITYYKNKQTKVKLVTQDELEKLEYFGENIFINLNKILENT